ncbi:glycosyltransferase family 39 protein [Capillimicrobium parvum]|uniref:Glycosyltransferase RgtA/B/C/D-like domain-containing protein n=1 Tax=Capillimicrobium parvum TaxID=2884022 RepID=A0A9E6Y3F7_9ACTN|nr:glycosyltransferase family 39 protein [Capillimicrobium parvum]UGS38751.1 hypothetical protein DSM104329_05181 [Capillimicrobium parvum]
MADVAVPLRESRARRVPAVLARVRWPLVGIVVLGALWTIWFVLQCTQYFIQPDELEYVKQSRLIAEELHPLLPGDRYFNSWSQLQPLLLAPVWAIRDTNLAHQIMGVVNALIMASAAIPAYLLTRRVVAERWAAYLVALLTVGIPWIAAAATMMTEVAAYPAWLWAAFAVHHAIARPSPKADVLGLAGVALAFSARPQLAVLGPALIAGVVLQELRYAGTGGDPLEPRRARIGRALKRSASQHRVLLALLVPALVVYAVVRPNLFGGYSKVGVTSSALSVPGLWDFSRELLAYVAVGVGVLPLAMAFAWVLLTLWRPAGRDQHAYALVLVIAGALLTVAVGSFTARYTPQGINSRYLYYLAPLLFIAMAALVCERRAAALPLGLGALFAGWIVYGAKLTQTGPSLVAPDQTFHLVLSGRTYQLGNAIGLPHVSLAHMVAVAGVVLVVALAMARRTHAARAASLAAVGLVVAFCLVETGYSLRKIADTQKGVSAEFIDGRHWIDAVVPDGQRAQLILSTMGDPASAYGVWWDTSFWNSSVDRSMQLPTTPDLQQPFPESFQILPDGSFAGYSFGLGPASVSGPGLGDGPWFVRATSDRSFGFRDAQVVAERFGVEVVRTPSPPRASWALYGTADDTGRILRGQPAATLAVYPASKDRTTLPVHIVLGTLPGSDRGQRYVVGDRRGRVPKGRTVEVDVDVPVGSGPYPAIKLRAPGRHDPQHPRGLQVLEVTPG